MLRILGLVFVGAVACGGKADSTEVSRPEQRTAAPENANFPAGGQSGGASSVPAPGSSHDCPVDFFCDLGCAIGDTECDGRLLLACANGGYAWATLQVCASAALCDPSGCIQPTCADGQRRCTGGQREQCNTDRTGFEPIETCASAARCTPDRCM